MPAPTPPFATSAQVASFMPSLANGSDFTSSSTPPKATVDSVLALVSSQIEMTFGQAGYLVPLAEIDGENWPSSQTSYLQLLAIMGTAGMVGGNVVKPAPALAPGRSGGTGNVFYDFFTGELKKIFDGQRATVRFRAKYYLGTPAERLISEPSGPTTDFFEGKYDPTRWLSFEAMTDKIRAIQIAQTDLMVQWDYLYGLFNQPFGASRYETWPENYV